MKCPYCKSDNITKNGHYKDIQRYKCKDCGKTFKNKNYNIKSKKEKEFVRALYKLLNVNLKEIDYKYKNLSLSKILDNSKNMQNNMDNFSIIARKDTWNASHSAYCQNPKIILCLCENEIRLVYLPINQFGEEHYNKRVSFKLAHYSDEEITVNGEKKIIKH